MLEYFLTVSFTRPTIGVLVRILFKTIIIQNKMPLLSMHVVISTYNILYVLLDTMVY